MQYKETDRKLIKEFKNEILSALEVRYFKGDKLMDTLRIATVYDPWFHLNYVENKEEVTRNYIVIYAGCL